MGYFKATFKSLTYQSILRISIRIIGFIKVAIIARLLGPIQFGIFGIATLVLALLETFTDTGMSIFLIQQGENYKKYLDSAFVISIFRGFIIALVILLLNPFVKIFFKIL